MQITAVIHNIQRRQTGIRSRLTLVMVILVMDCPVVTATK